MPKQLRVDLEKKKKNEKFFNGVTQPYPSRAIHKIFHVTVFNRMYGCTIFIGENIFDQKKMPKQGGGWGQTPLSIGPKKLARERDILAGDLFCPCGQEWGLWKNFFR